MSPAPRSALETVRRGWARLRQRRTHPGFHSQFGGLWSDRLDAEHEIERRVRAGELARDDAARLAFWRSHGFWIEKGAFDSGTIDVLQGELDGLWSGAPLVELGGRVEPLRAGLRGRHCKLVDAYALSAAALEAALAPPLQRFLRLVFDEAPRLFQSLTFEYGSEQPVHQDTAYVVVSPPLALVAAWIALEDVRAGSGELVYLPGSHRLADHRFSGGAKNWNRERDGIAAQEHYHSALLAHAAQYGLKPETFLPRRGDVLFWSADLAHGGTPIRDPRLTRKSLVCHYCPLSARPYYTVYLPDRRLDLPHPSGARAMSAHYDLRLDLEQRRRASRLGSGR